MALQLDLAIAKFLEEEGHESTVGNTVYDVLGKLHKHLLKGGIQLCWIYKELLAFKNLSLEWSQWMPSNWLVSDNIPTSGPALYDLAHPLFNWANASAKLDADLCAQCQIMWCPTSQLFEMRQNAPLWYWFGNLKVDEMPDGFEACMRAIKTLVDEGNDSSSNAPHVEPQPALGRGSKHGTAAKKTTSLTIPKTKSKASSSSTSTSIHV
ncbi:hypothetical protein FRC11_002927 [Ceratobasidium sp. 423]|nr:hypothetical protein FRC11_002927 [Ceratobasidium sp. 423]